MQLSMHSNPEEGVLLTAALVYLFELHLLGIDSYGLRLPISLLIIAAAVSIFFYLRQQMRKQ